MDSEIHSLNNYQENKNSIPIRDVESMEDYEPIVMEQLHSRPSASSAAAVKTKLVKTTHSSPNAWFGLVRTGTDNPGNPFKDEETSLAIILDFSTSRLQIFSRNMPKYNAKHRK